MLFSYIYSYTKKYIRERDLLTSQLFVELLQSAVADHREPLRIASRSTDSEDGILLFYWPLDDEVDQVPARGHLWGIFFVWAGGCIVPPLRFHRLEYGNLERNITRRFPDGLKILRGSLQNGCFFPLQSYKFHYTSDGACRRLSGESASRYAYIPRCFILYYVLIKFMSFLLIRIQTHRGLTEFILLDQKKKFNLIKYLL